MTSFTFLLVLPVLLRTLVKFHFHSNCDLGLSLQLAISITFQVIQSQSHLHRPRVQRTWRQSLMTLVVFHIYIGSCCFPVLSYSCQSLPGLGDFKLVLLRIELVLLQLAPPPSICLTCLLLIIFSSLHIAH